MDSTEQGILIELQAQEIARQVHRALANEARVIALERKLQEAQADEGAE